MTIVHQLPQLFHLLCLTQSPIVTRGLKIVHALALCKDVHGPLIEEELRILSAHFLHMGHILHQFKAVVHVACLLNLGGGVAARAEGGGYELEHVFVSLIHGFLQLLKRRHRCIKEVLVDASSQGQDGHGKATLNDALIVASAHCEHFGRGRQRVGHYQTDRVRHVDILS